MTTKSHLEWEQWDHLPDVYVRLHKDDLGYPPGEWEQLKAEPTEKPDAYRIKSIPFYARGLAYEDEILTTTSEEGYSPAFKSVAKRSGYSTVRLLITEDEDKDKLIEYFTELDIMLEFDGRLVALAIPRNAYDEVIDYVCTEKEKGRWGAEEGFLIIDDPGDEMAKDSAG